MPPDATPAHTVSRSTGAWEPGAAGGGAAAPLHPTPLAQRECLACGGDAHAGQNVRGRGEAGERRHGATVVNWSHHSDGGVCAGCVVQNAKTPASLDQKAHAALKAAEAALAREQENASRVRERR